MINMIKADFYRTVRNIAFYIALGIVLLMLGLSIYIIQPGSMGQVNTEEVDTTSYSQSSRFDELSVQDMSNMSIKDMRQFMLDSEGYELDRDILGTNMNLYYIFIFITVIAITNDFSSGSIKNTLSSAINRKKYFLSKCAFVFCVCTGIFLLNTYVCYFANLIFNSGKVSSDIWTMTKVSLIQLPVMAALMSILIGIAFSVKKTSIFNVIAIPLIMVFQLILNLVITLFNINNKIADYELQVMINKLAAEPSKGYIIISFIYCAAIIALFLSLGYISFRKSEIK